MKYKTFRNIAATAFAGTVVGLGWWAFSGGGDAPPEVAKAPAPVSERAPTGAPAPTSPALPPVSGPVAAAPLVAVSPAAPPPSAVLPAGAEALRSLDRQIIARITQPLSGDKVKDAIPGSAKVNLYQDAGQTHVNRLKVDLDRDDKWDEKWTIDRAAGLAIQRQLAPNDDEAYSVEWRLGGEAWVK